MFKISTLPNGYFDANCHLIMLPDSTCMIDPCVDERYLPVGLKPIKLLLATHGHFDHISHADLYRKDQDARLMIHPMDADCLTEPNLNLSVMMQRSTQLMPPDGLLSDGQMLELDDQTSIKVIHTPGHTPGGVCFLLYDQSAPAALFTGDTLFAGSIGRIDLGGSASDMKKTLAFFGQLDEDLQGADIEIYPGHGPSTTLKRECQTNPYLNGMAI